MDKSRVLEYPATPATNIDLIGWEKQQCLWQTNHKSCENEPYCKITNNLQKAAVMLWQFTVLRRFSHIITDATQQDANLWPAPKIESKIKVCKKAQRWARRVLELRWDKYEPLSKWWESKSVEKKETANTASSVKHGGGGLMSMHGCLWNKPSRL